MRSAFPHGPLLVAAILAASACAHPQSGHQASAPDSQGASRYVSQDQIRRSGATTAWQALQYTVPFYRFEASGKVRHRGVGSIILHDQPKIVVDGVTLTEVSMLMAMPATDLESIRVMNAPTATTYYGTNSSAGVIVIQTKTGDD
jgi:hypothetical protein